MIYRIYSKISSNLCWNHVKLLDARAILGVNNTLGLIRLHTCSTLNAGKNDGKSGKPPELDNYEGKEFTSAWQIKQKGRIYDKKPFKVACKKDKVYMWCACGLSKSQPFCDGSHKGPLMQSMLKPVLFIAAEDKDYWFCNCKQTDHRPLCDGTHKKQEIQDAIRS